MGDHEHGHDDHSELGEMDVRVRALETLLTEKGLIDPAALDELIDTYQNRIGPQNGARVVARAWVDPDYREEQGAAIMKQENISMTVDLGMGSGEATVWTCDLTHGYISINADYRS